MSSSDSDSDSSDDDSSSYNIPLVDHLATAIHDGDLVNLRRILSQEDENGRAAVVTDDDIHAALSIAANVGSVDACRLLWGTLSPDGKRTYFATTIASWCTPLHAAVKRGHLEIVRLFIEEFKWNANQKNYDDQTPLCCAVDHLETARYLLENGANVNQGGQYGPLWYAVHTNNTDTTRLLLVEYRANPNLNRRPPDEEDFNQQQSPRSTDFAIMWGNAEILRMLLDHGAFVGICKQSGIWPGTTHLNMLLCNRQKSRETKVAICRILIAHATEDHATSKFLQDTFESTIKLQTGNIAECLRILIHAGFDPRTAIYYAIRVENLLICQVLVNEYRVDPFLQQEVEDENDDTDDIEPTTAVSPFLASARLPGTRLFEYFLSLWDERFSSSNGSGKNSDGDYPIHVVCCDAQVSLQAIQLLVQRHPDALAVVDGEQGLLPFHFAANWGASLDVIFYLLQHRPEALRHGGNAAASATTAGHVQNDLDVLRGPAQKKAKTSHDS